jgi:HEPN domain-containing protein
MMQTETLEKIVSTVTAKIDIDKIFLYPESANEGETEVLLVLIANHFQLSLTDLTVQVKGLIGDLAPLCELEVAFSHQIRETMQFGNLYYYTRCVDRNLIYTRPNSVYNMFDGLPPLSEVLTRAGERYNTAIKKIDPFLDGAELYCLKEVYPSAAFMLHQVVELAFRAVELFFLGKETRNHEISIHLRYLERHLCYPKIRFPVKTADEALLRLLDDAYLGVRYGDLYQISREQVEKLMEWAKDFLDFVHQTKATFMEHCVQDVVTIQKCTPTNDAEAGDIQRVVSRINETLPAEVILCVGRRTEVTSREGCFESEPSVKSLVYYDLLIICKEEPLNVLLLQAMINDLPGLQSRVNLLAHLVNEVLNDKGCDFLSGALHRGEIWYGEERAISLRDLSGSTERSRFANEAPSICNDRLHKAKAFLQAVEAVRYEGGFEISVVLMAQCLEQACLGVIRARLSYRPKIYNLRHLLTLCHMISADFEEIIPQRTSEDKRLYKMLADGFADLRYRDEVDYDMDILQLLYRRCEAFVEKARESSDYNV